MSMPMTSQSHSTPQGRTSVPFVESRRAERRRVDYPIRLGWINDDKRMEYLAGRCIDLSSNGLAVATGSRLRLSALIHLEIAGLDIVALGRVRNCIQAAGGWRAGIELVLLP